MMHEDMVRHQPLKLGVAQRPVEVWTVQGAETLHRSVGGRERGIVAMPREGGAPRQRVTSASSRSSVEGRRE